MPHEFFTPITGVASGGESRQRKRNLFLNSVALLTSDIHSEHPICPTAMLDSHPMPITAKKKLTKANLALHAALRNDGPEKEGSRR